MLAVTDRCTTEHSDTRTSAYPVDHHDGLALTPTPPSLSGKARHPRTTRLVTTVLTSTQERTPQQYRATRGTTGRWASTSQSVDGLLDECDALGQWTRRYLDELEPEVAVQLFVELLEDERVLEADPPGRGGLDKALVADEEDRCLVHALRHDSLDLPCQQVRRCEAKVVAQSQNAHR